MHQIAECINGVSHVPVKQGYEVKYFAIFGLWGEFCYNYCMNKLDNLEEFKKLLAGYQPSEEAKKLLKKTKLVLFVGPSSSGKNTIINELVKSGEFASLVSDTTRKPRENDGIMEQNGREYWFRTEADILQDVKDGMFLEASVIHNQQVSGQSVRELIKTAEKGLISINEIEVVGADNVYAIKPDTQFYFVMPPSFDEWMARMRVRGVLPEDEAIRRMQSAEMEIEMALSRPYYRFVVNDTFVKATERLEKMIETDSFSDADQAEGKAVAMRLLADVKQHLADKV